MRPSRSTNLRTKSSGSGHGKPGVADLRLTVPCRATQMAVLSAKASVLSERPAAMQASERVHQESEALGTELEHRRSARVRS